MTSTKCFKDANKYAGCKIPGIFNVVTFGDVHLGHRRTKTPETLSGLYHLLDHTNLDELDAIFIEGDLFDRGLELYNEYLPQIQIWMLWLLELCHKHNIILRVLEGTPSHDMRQSAQFEVLVASSKLDLDFKYVADLMVEQHENGFSILYVPDEWTTDHDRTYIEAKLAIEKAGLEQVSMALMHGNFEHQLPIQGLPCFVRKHWEALVEDAIFIGHIHQYSLVGKTVAAGSFDRHSHNDEKAKGHIHAKLSASGSTFDFVRNKYAKQYITIDVSDMKVAKGCKLIEHTLKTLPAKSYVRIKYTREDAYDNTLFFMKETYPDYFWSELVVDPSEQKKEKGEATLMPIHNFTSVSITKQNIQSLMATKLEQHEDAQMVKAALARLEALCAA